MERINTDYKRQIWKIEAKLFNMRKPWRSSFKLHVFLISFCPVKAVSNMYMYEGHDYRDTSTKDQEAFDNMMAGKVVILTSLRVWKQKPWGLNTLLTSVLFLHSSCSLGCETDHVFSRSFWKWLTRAFDDSRTQAAPRVVKPSLPRRASSDTSEKKNYKTVFCLKKTKLVDDRLCNPTHKSFKFFELANYQTAVKSRTYTWIFLGY